MKSSLLLIVAAAVATVLIAGAAAPATGPRGGRLFESAPLRAEFVVNSSRRAEIRFYTPALDPAARTTQTAQLTVEPAAGRTRLDLEPTDFGFVTREPLPAGDPYRVVVQLRATPEAKPQNFRLDLNLSPCGGCKRAEYACTCESH